MWRRNEESYLYTDGEVVIQLGGKKVWKCDAGAGPSLWYITEGHGHPMARRCMLHENRPDAHQGCGAGWLV
jgi:hypothetical protein